MKRPRKQLLLKLGVFLLLGAIVNVAVAWGIAVVAPLRVSIDHGGVFEPATTPEWDTFVLAKGGVVLIDAVASVGEVRTGPNPFPPAPKWSIAASAPEESLARTGARVQEIAYGWPSISMYSRSVMPWFAYAESVTLPSRGIWPGFAINTIFYAALLWVLWIAPGKIRRLVRIRRGCCPACGFIIAPGTCSNGLCSECGVALPERLRTQST